MAPILEFPVNLSPNTVRDVHNTRVVHEGAQISRAVETLGLLLQQADRTLAAMLIYEAELAAQAHVIR